MTNYDRIKQMSIEEIGYLLLCPYSTDDTDLFMCNKEALMFELNTIIDNLCKYRDAMNDDDIDALREILRDGRERKEKSNELYAEHARRTV